jgi:hypothetical protein
LGREDTDSPCLPTRNDIIPPHDNRSTTNRQCVDCKKAPQMQCLHCSKYVCMECAQKHVARANEQANVVLDILNNKLNILDRLSAEAKERVTTERNRIIHRAETEQKQASTQIDKLLEQYKTQVREKNTQLSQQSLDKIPTFIEQMTRDLDYILETNQQLFSPVTIMSKIHVQHSLDLNH